MTKVLTRAFCAAAFCAAVLAPAQAGQILINGDFETGNFYGWARLSQSGSAGGLYINPNGADAPLSGSPTTMNPDGENFFAISDQFSPGSYSLIQSFTLPFATQVTVSFDFFANSYGGLEITEPRRDYTAGPNENAEVNILTGGANPFTVNPADIVATLYGPGIDPGSNPHPWVHYSINMGIMDAGTYLIRFAETDNQDYFNMGVDNVVVDAEGLTVPEPISLALMGAGLAGMGVWRRRKPRR